MKALRKPLLIGLMLIVGGFAFAQGKTSPAISAKSTSSPTNNTSVSDFPVIGHIEKQDRTITIKAGPKSTIYLVKSADGKVLCDNVTLDQLRAQAPELHEFVKTAVAGNLTNGATADSRIRVTDDGPRTKSESRIR